MKKYIYIILAIATVAACIVFLLFAFPNTSEASELRFDTEYDISAAFTNDLSTVYVDEQVNIKNVGNNKTDVLWFHIRSNRFATDSGQFDVTSIVSNNGEILSYKLSGYGQLCRVDLPSQLEPGNEVSLKFTPAGLIYQNVKIYMEKIDTVKYIFPTFMHSLLYVTKRDGT